MSALVQISIKGHIADVHLNRPNKYNSLNPDMFKAIVDAGRALAKDTTVRAVVLSGEGRGFCAGLDFKSFMQMASSGQKISDVFEYQEGEIGNYAQMLGLVWKSMPVPVIAALHGVAFGGGLQIALGADIRLATPDTQLSVMEINWGLVPDMSLTQTIRDIVRIDVAKELTFTGRIVNADEAAQLGLITRICDNALEEAHKMAAQIASKSPDAIAAAKHLLDTAWHTSPEQGLRLEAALQKSIIGSPNQVEAVRANLEKRPAQYSHRKPTLEY